MSFATAISSFSGKANAGALLVALGADVGPLRKDLAVADRLMGSHSRKQAAESRMLSAGIVKGVGVATIALAAISAAGVVAAIKYESAFAGVRKTVDATEAEFARLSDSLRAMAREMPTSITEIAGVAEAAGQLGIATQDIVAFTAVMTDLGATTNITSQQAATDLARLANITQMSADDYSRLGSTIVDLGNKSAATEAEIVSMAMRIAGAGQQIGMSEAQMLSWATALSSVGIEAELGGSAISRIFLEMNSAVKGQTGELKVWANTAGMSVAQFSQLFRKDASGAAVAFVKGMQKAQAAGEDLSGVLNALGLNNIRIIDTMGRLSGSGDLLTRTIETGNRAWEENVALSEEANKRYATTESKLLIMRNNLHDLAIAFGGTMAPAVGDVAEALTEVFGALADLPEPAMKAISYLALVGIGAGTLVVVLTSLQGSLARTALLFKGMGAAAAGASAGLRLAASAASLALAAAAILGLAAASEALSPSPTIKESGKGPSILSPHSTPPVKRLAGRGVVAGAEDQVTQARALAQAEEEVTQAYEAQQQSLDDLMAAEALQAAHVAAMTTSLAAMLDPQQAWTLATQEAKTAAGEHAKTLGLSAEATQAYVEKAKGTLTDFMDYLQEQKDAQDRLIINQREIIKRLIGEGFSPEAIKAIMEQVATLPADIVDKYAQASEPQFDRMTGLMVKFGERNTDGWLEGVVSDLDRRMQAPASKFTDGWRRAMDSRMPVAGKSGGLQYADGWIQAADRVLKNWEPSLGGIADGWLRKGLKAGAGAAGDIDLAGLMGMMWPGMIAGNVGGLAGSTGNVWTTLKTIFPMASWMGGYATSGHIANSDHYTGHAFDVGGTSAYMARMSDWLTANFTRLGLKYIIYNREINSGSGWRRYGGANPHTDHVHVSTYHTGGEVPAVLQVGERVLTAEQNSFLAALSGSLRDLIDVLRDQVNADKEIPKGGKGAAANERIVDLFGERKSTNASYVQREDARLGALKALGYDATILLAVVERQITFLDKSVAEAAAQLQFAKDRLMSPETINGLATELFNLQTEAAGAREELAELIRLPLEQELDRWGSALSRTLDMMDLLSNHSNAAALQLGLLPSLLGGLQAQFQGSMDLMAKATSPDQIMGYAGAATNALMGSFQAEKRALDQALTGTLDSINSSQDAWLAEWDNRGAALDIILQNEARSISSHYETLAKAQRKRLSDLDKSQRDELDKLSRFYDDKLRLMEDNERGITREEQRGRESRSLALLENELRQLVGQESHTFADVARISELETQIQAARDQMSQQEAAWAREDARSALEREREEALERLGQKQEEARTTLESQIEAQLASLESQQQSDLDKLEARRKAFEQERTAALAHFDQLRRDAQAAYQAQLDAVVVRYQQQLQALIDYEQQLLGQTGNLFNAGYSLGLSFAAGLTATLPWIQQAALAAAQVVADYLQLASPAKRGPLSTLNHWWDPMGTMLGASLKPGILAHIVNNALMGKDGGVSGLKPFDITHGWQKLLPGAGQSVLGKDGGVNPNRPHDLNIDLKLTVEAFPTEAAPLIPELVRQIVPAVSFAIREEIRSRVYSY